MKHSQGRVRELTAVGLLGALSAAGISPAQDEAARLRPARSADAVYLLESSMQIGDEPAERVEARFNVSWEDLGDATTIASITVSSVTLQRVVDGETISIVAELEDGGLKADVDDGWDDASAIAVRKLFAAPMQVFVSEEGRVEGVRQATSRMATGIGPDALPDGALGPLAGDQLARTLEPVFRLDEAPVEMPADWETTRQWPLGPSRTVTLDGVWTGEAGEGGASWTGTLAIALTREDGASPVSPGATVESFDGEVVAAFDAERGLLRSRVERLAFETIWTIGDVQERVRVQTSTTLRLLDQPDDSD